MFIQFFRHPRNILLSFYVFTVIAGLSVFFQLSLYLYENIYKTIYNSDQILILRSMVTIEAVDIAKLNEVMESLENKKKSCSDSARD